MKRLHLLMPFLYGIAPVLTLFANNTGQAKFSETFLPFGVMVLATLVLLPVCRLLTRSWVRGAVYLSLFWLVFFSYGHVAKLVGRFPIAGHNPGNFKFLLPVTVLLLVFLLWVLRRSRTEPVRIASILMVVVAAMLITPAIHIVRFQSTVQPAPASAVLPDERIAAGETKRRPDMYYFILDRYASQATLTHQYQFDNSPFLDALRGHGFYVADDSRANYLVTAQSLASSLNMAHVLPLGDAIGPRSTDWEPVFALIANNRLSAFLKQQGYRYVHVGPEWVPTHSNPLADVTHSYRGLPEFMMLLVNTTAAYPVLYRMGINNEDTMKFNGVHDQLTWLSSVPRGEASPKFVFVHILVPHGPFVFNRDGTYRLPDVANVATEHENYLHQMEFINTRMQSLVTGILGAYGPGDQPVIVIQGDEGPYPVRGHNHAFDWTTATDDEINEKMRILNAIYAPECAQALYSRMTPVNTFRIVLNHYFGTNLPLLEDRSYSYRDLQHLYEFIEVTDRIDRYPG